MKLKLIVLTFIAILAIGCGYENSSECQMKERQKCQTENCSKYVLQYCLNYDYKK
jgi:hypothetical protein